MEKENNTNEIDQTKLEETIDTNVEEQTQEVDQEISELDKVKQELEVEKDKFLRLFAEFENYKRRTTKERIDMFKTAGQEVIQSLLPVMDDFDRALKEYSDEKEDPHVQGMTLISNKFKETLKSKGLDEATVNVGDAFDAELHEAITQIPAPKKKLVGKVVDVIEKGYKLGDKIIRFPKVVTGK